MLTIMYLLAIANLTVFSVILEKACLGVMDSACDFCGGGVCGAPARPVVQGCSVQAVQIFFALARQKSFCMLLSSSGGLRGMRVSIASRPT